MEISPENDVARVEQLQMYRTIRSVQWWIMQETSRMGRPPAGIAESTHQSCTAALEAPAAAAPSNCISPDDEQVFSTLYTMRAFPLLSRAVGRHAVAREYASIPT